MNNDKQIILWKVFIGLFTLAFIILMALVDWKNFTISSLAFPAIQIFWIVFSIIQLKAAQKRAKAHE